MVTVIVSGGRDFVNENFVYDNLNQINAKRKITKVVSGRARGVDTFAEMWARTYAIPFVGYPAQWNKHGNAAGPIRNQEMLDREKPAIVIAFPGGKGTQDMRIRARASGIELIDTRETYDAFIRELNRAKDLV